VLLLLLLLEFLKICSALASVCLTCLYKKTSFVSSGKLSNFLLYVLYAFNSLRLHFPNITLTNWSLMNGKHHVSARSFEFTVLERKFTSALVLPRGSLIISICTTLPR